MQYQWYHSSGSFNIELIVAGTCVCNFQAAFSSLTWIFNSYINYIANGLLNHQNLLIFTWWNDQVIWMSILFDYRVRYLLLNWNLKIGCWNCYWQNRRHMLTGLSHSVPRSNALDLTSIIQVECCLSQWKQLLNFEHHIILKIRIFMQLRFGNHIFNEYWKYRCTTLIWCFGHVLLNL